MTTHHHHHQGSGHQERRRHHFRHQPLPNRRSLFIASIFSMQQPAQLTTTPCIWATGERGSSSVTTVIRSRSSDGVKVELGSGSGSHTRSVKVTRSFVTLQDGSMRSRSRSTCQGQAQWSRSSYVVALHGRGHKIEALHDCPR